MILEPAESSALTSPRGRRASLGALKSRHRDWHLRQLLRYVSASKRIQKLAGTGILK